MCLHLNLFITTSTAEIREMLFIFIYYISNYLLENAYSFFQFDLHINRKI